MILRLILKKQKIIKIFIKLIKLLILNQTKMFKLNMKLSHLNCILLLIETKNKKNQKNERNK